jgi:hypothetical protein
MKQKMMGLFVVFHLLIGVLVFTDSSDSEGKDKLKEFYERISKPDVKYCADPTRLLPQCQECIPGTRIGPNSNSCNQFVPSSQAIRDELLKLSKERYGDKLDASKPFALYPCKTAFLQVTYI